MWSETYQYRGILEIFSYNHAKNKCFTLVFDMFMVWYTVQRIFPLTNTYICSIIHSSVTQVICLLTYTALHYCQVWKRSYPYIMSYVYHANI